MEKAYREMHQIMYDINNDTSGIYHNGNMFSIKKGSNKVKMKRK